MRERCRAVLAGLVVAAVLSLAGLASAKRPVAAPTTLAPPEVPEAARKLSLMAYGRLASQQASPEVTQAYQTLVRQAPELLWNPFVAKLAGVACLPTSKPTPGVEPAAIGRARGALADLGKLDLLKNKEVRRAFVLWANRASMPEKLEAAAAQAAPFFKSQREAALGRACLANRKCLCGAMEMYSLDKNAAPPPLTAELVQQLVTGGYLQNDRASTCPASGRLLEAPAGPDSVTCDLHGSIQSPKAPANPYTEAQVKALMEENCMVWASRELAGQELASPTGAIAQRVCGAARKTLAGAVEMFRLDKGRNPAGEALDELVAGGYLQKAGDGCCPADRRPLEVLFAEGDAKGDQPYVVRCPTHGDLR